VRLLDDPLGGVFYVVNGRGHDNVAAAREAVLQASRSFDVEPWLLVGSIEAAPEVRFEYVVAALEAVFRSRVHDVILLGRAPGEVYVPAVAVPVQSD